jgi:hypothetical protein
MGVETWDPEQALLDVAADDDDEEGCDSATRYGVTEWEMRGSVPLAVALAEELPDDQDEPISDEQWLLVDDDSLLPPPRAGHCAEELAMHLETV